MRSNASISISSHNRASSLAKPKFKSLQLLQTSLHISAAAVLPTLIVEIENLAKYFSAISCDSKSSAPIIWGKIWSSDNATPSAVLSGAIQIWIFLSWSINCVINSLQVPIGTVDLIINKSLSEINVLIDFMEDFNWSKLARLLMIGVPTAIIKTFLVFESISGISALNTRESSSNSSNADCKPCS